MAGAVAEVNVRGLRELVRAFNRMDKDLASDLVMELQEAADPARKLTEQYILGGGGGLGEMVGVDSYYAGMRIGVSRGEGMVYVAPAWRSNKGTPQGRVLAAGERRRMEAAVRDKADEIEKRLGDFIDRLADEWGD